MESEVKILLGGRQAMVKALQDQGLGGLMCSGG